jgi:D-erythro-7,8-dihydroneopterin triphosphate epimerase
MIEISIKNLKVKTKIGCTEQEKKKAKEIIIDIALNYKADLAIIEDNIEKAVNYQTIYEKINIYLKHSQFNLIESLAKKVLEIIMENSLIEMAEVKVKKPSALKKAEYAGVKIWAKRDLERKIVYGI